MIVKLAGHYLNTSTGAFSKSPISKDDIDNRLDHTPLELLLCLIRYKNKNVTKSMMLQEVWQNKIVSEDVISVAISQIRKNLGDKARRPTIIKTIPGVGYRLIADVIEIDGIEVSIHEQPISNGLLLKKRWPIFLITSMMITGIYIIFLKYGIPPLTNTHPQLPSDELVEMQQKARYQLTLEDIKSWQQAEKQFKDIIISSPNYAPAYRDLVEAKLKLLADNGVEKLKKINELYRLLEESFRLEPNNHLTHLLYANIAFAVEWNFKLANEHYQRTVQLNPQNAESQIRYAEFLLASGNYELAIKHIKNYIHLMPNAYAIPSVAWVYNMMGDYDTALMELEKLKQLQSDSFIYHVSAQAILENKGQEEESFVELVEIFKALDYSENEIVTVNKVFKTGGLAAVNLWLLETKKEQNDIGQYTPPLSFARYAIVAGKRELAVAYIQQAFLKRDFSLLWFNVDPKYQSIRNHPKLRNLINPSK